MLNYTQFFPTGSGGGGGGGSGIQSLPTDTRADYRNRQIFTGPYTETWSVPDGVTEVEVHVWGGGGGGSGACCGGGGGGGGYARTRLQVTSDDSLSITVGGDAGTSSVTVPTQSPGSPISATGGSNSLGSNDPTKGCPGANFPQPTSCGTCNNCGFLGGLGGTGTVSLAPTQPTEYCFTAWGGKGAMGSFECILPTFTNIPSGAPTVHGRCWSTFGAGGAAGSPRGPGGGCTFDDERGPRGFGAPGGAGIGQHIGGSVFCTTIGPTGYDSTCNTLSPRTVAGSGGGSFGSGVVADISVQQPTCPTRNTGIMQIAGAGKEAQYVYSFNMACAKPSSCPTCCKIKTFSTGGGSCLATSKSDNWWRVEDIAGGGGLGANGFTGAPGTAGHAGGGGGGFASNIQSISVSGDGGNYSCGIMPTSTMSCGFRLLPGAPGGFLGGGGSGAWTQQATSWCIHTGIENGMGGYAGGSNGGSPGTPGVVIIYW